MSKRATIEDLNELSEAIIGAAIAVHRELGPGLLESAYEACLVFELRGRGFVVEQQKPCPVQYRGLEIECGYRLDLLVNGLVVVELKSVDQLLPVHEAQLLSYLKLSGIRLGLLMNFNVERLHQGIKRRLNG